MAFRRCSPLLLATFLVAAVPSIVSAQEITSKPDFTRLTFTPEPVTGARLATFADRKAETLESPRPSIVMTSLYAATVVTQSLDVHSTMRALNAGAVERNPMMEYLTSHPGAFAAVKAGTAAGLIFAGRSLAKRNKMHAVIALVAVNSAYVLIAAHNYRVANRLQGR